MKILIISFAALLTTACTSYQLKPEVESQECTYYHSKKAAPMPPSAMNELKQRCLDSQK
ncbi:hypothetical protein GCM10025882_26870 [Acinetobacter gyllenbergii]|uniref:Lipoprotein n=1 Tax=Acinetobacter gyllenbergii CIP 110306 = MTCC 11365 TaxID=1217657 RepID=A0A829HDU4_9GAMM|nr:hypothetical protein [Acinetobacter gyllenbergii]EPF70801.1 hypothetical protein F957_03935 [Acinetobacter gyllenbergii CIP 110306 = MTCC 11365]EPH35690.1 hypothetical protein L293_0281 [Acinetobacter gyllenbergii CIP 110306 = MTCC 11365]ESK56816.1 hypothetical protein F987_00307 [Acinetobacter gyllenbergii NIPH 230]MCU4582892.1 hypothetical protein [Acinetobacter gyllenbergii]GMA12262.1 hypothetical protein GCM10025882_26870 [Acinetobacter gyllenbergii]